MNDYTDAAMPPAPTRPGNATAWAAAALFLLPWLVLFTARRETTMALVLPMFLCMAAATLLALAHFIRRLLWKVAQGGGQSREHYLGHAIGPLIVFLTHDFWSKFALHLGQEPDIPAQLRIVFSAAGTAWPFAGLFGLGVALVLFWLAWKAKPAKADEGTSA